MDPSPAGLSEGLAAVRAHPSRARSMSSTLIHSNGPASGAGGRSSHPLADQAGRRETARAGVRSPTRRRPRRTLPTASGRRPGSAGNVSWPCAKCGSPPAPVSPSSSSDVLPFALRRRGIRAKRNRIAVPSVDGALPSGRCRATPRPRRRHDVPWNEDAPVPFDRPLKEVVDDDDGRSSEDRPAHGGRTLVRARPGGRRRPSSASTRTPASRRRGRGAARTRTVRTRCRRRSRRRAAPVPRRSTAATCRSSWSAPRSCRS